MEKQDKNRVVRRHVQNTSDTYFIARILSIILVFIVLELNFIGVWSLNVLVLLAILAIYTVFIFYPRKGKNTNLDIMKFALGVVFIFVGISVLTDIFVNIITIHYPFNVTLLESIYALFWVVIGWFLIIKSHYTNLSSRFIK